jgi:hypothetical protein
MMPIGVGVSPVFDLDGRPRLSPEMLRGFEGGLPFPGNREGEGKVLLRAWWWVHHSAKKMKRSLFDILTYCR